MCRERQRRVHLYVYGLSLRDCMYYLCKEQGMEVSIGRRVGGDVVHESGFAGFHELVDPKVLGQDQKQLCRLRIDLFAAVVVESTGICMYERAFCVYS